MFPDRRMASLIIISILVASAISVSVLYQPVSGDSPTVGNNASQTQTSLLQDISQPVPGVLSILSTQYPVYFNETGLPTGTMWNVTVSSSIYASTNSSIMIALSPGTYHYTVSNVLHFYVNNSVGSLVVGPGTNSVTLNYRGVLSPSSYINLYSGKIVSRQNQLSENQSVFPVYGTFDNFTQDFLTVGFSNSLVYEINASNLSQICHFKGPYSPVAVSSDPHNGNIYVINSTSVFVYSSSGVLLASKFLGSYLISIIYFPAANQIAIGNLYGSIEFLNVSTLHVDHIIEGISVFSSQSMTYNTNLGLLEVINDSSSGGSVAFVASNDQVAYSVEATGELISVIYDPQTSTTYYTSSAGTSSYLYILGPGNNGPIPGTGNTFGLGLDPYLNAVFATNTQNSTIVVVNATSDQVIYTIQESGMPLMAINLPGEPTMLITNPMNDALDIISLSNVTSRVTFEGNGLTAGTKWSVTLNSYTMSSTENRISFYELPGKYDYSVAEVKGYASLHGGTVDVGTSDLTVSLNFTRTYAVSFVESGLPSGSTWGAKISGTTIYSSDGYTSPAYLTNGTYHFSVINAPGYFSSPQSGYITVNGTSLSIPVQFSNAAFNLSFVSSGLPAGTAWAMIINGVMEETGNSTLTYSSVPGTYVYSIAALQGYYPATNASGSQTVVNAPVTVNVTWLPYLYAVNFSENNLPPGTKWFVNLSDGTHLSSTNRYIEAYLKNGQYEYSAASANSSWKGSSGAFTINGSATEVHLQFVPVTYAVVFKESGLPAGTEWEISVHNSIALSTTSGEISGLLQNGTYAFTANTTDTNYTTLNGTFIVSGSGKTVSLQFNLLTYNVTFIEGGLPLGTQWGVDLSGLGIYNSSSPYLNMSLGIGSYSFTPLPVPGYNSSNGGYFTISSHNLTLYANYTYIPPQQKLYNITIYELGLPEGLYWAIELNDSYQASYPGGSFDLSLANGSYNLEIMAVNHDGKIMPGSVGTLLHVQGSNQSIIVVFYGPYVWFIVDFSTSCFHGDHGDQSWHHNDEGHSSDYVTADARRF